MACLKSRLPLFFHASLKSGIVKVGWFYMYAVQQDTQSGLNEYVLIST